jgi:hypothetical protein
MFLVSPVAISAVLVIKAIDTTNTATLSSYANIRLYPLALSAIRLKLTSFLSLSRSI